MHVADLAVKIVGQSLRDRHELLHWHADCLLRQRVEMRQQVSASSSWHNRYSTATADVLRPAAIGQGW